ncbi:uncharacterized protein PHALS_09711 [Plasmopara halstedii]|uniref:Uncharacterized protein n=1 Tax=Plasmopara halstedii TaxID=4781 RepID=A0A0P1AEH2_PLAHL|nr:uncharacterized protein PHALS_09711 [Plasmopara halstedii]CEG39466.1 hypothetical protein PHALS_09711 [Plasmopara halstedii]|eukprot:XP_024575835.1 hypothetical protein PHALS_09711 [Plasmopara halstedii]
MTVPNKKRGLLSEAGRRENNQNAYLSTKKNTEKYFLRLASNRLSELPYKAKSEL